MEEDQVVWMGGTFLLFCLLFTIPFMLGGDSAERDTAVAMDAAAESAGSPSRDSSQTSTQSITAALAVIILSGVATFLSWQVVGDMRRGEVTALSSEEGERIVDALANDTCREILRVLEGERLAVSELAESLDMSIQRVQYNVDKLDEAGLVKSDAFKYSERGKEMDLYELAERRLMIGPE